MLHCLHFEANMNSVVYGDAALMRIMLITVVIIIIVFIGVAIVVDMMTNIY